MKTYKVIYNTKWQTDGRKVHFRSTFNLTRNVQAESAPEAVNLLIDLLLGGSTKQVWASSVEETTEEPTLRTVDGVMQYFYKGEWHNTTPRRTRSVAR